MAFGAQTSFQMNGPGPNGVLSSIYIGPYDASVGGVATPVICDDFADETYFGESWTANVFNFSDLSVASNLNQTKWGNLTLYQEAAWLGLQLMNPPATCGGASNCAGDIQFAIWQLMDPGDNPISLLTGVDKTNTQTWLNQAATHSSTQFTLYSYVPNTAVGCPGGRCTPPQEFMVVHTPESSEIAMLGADFAALGVVVFLVRRKKRPALA